MSILIVLLRLIHIVAGAFWSGAAVAYFLFFGPTAKGLGPAGPQFMQALVGKHRYPVFMNVASMLTILAGLALYWFSSGGLTVAWLISGPGLGFTLGSLASGRGPSVWVRWDRPLPRPAVRPRPSSVQNWAGWTPRCTLTNAGT